MRKGVVIDSNSSRDRSVCHPCNIPARSQKIFHYRGILYSRDTTITSHTCVYQTRYSIYNTRGSERGNSFERSAQHVVGCVRCLRTYS